MKLGSIVIALAALAVIAAQPAEARKKHHAKRHAHIAKVQCRDTAETFSWSFLWDLNRAPHWNGCSPAVYDGRRFTGQDPDINIRLKLKRDPSEGYYDDH